MSRKKDVGEARSGEVGYWSRILNSKTVFHRTTKPPKSEPLSFERACKSKQQSIIVLQKKDGELGLYKRS